MVGGGDSAMEEALFLTRFATKVTLIYRREQFRSSHIMLERAMAHDNIKFLTNTAVLEVMGVEQKEVSGLRLRNTLNNDESTLPVSAMFLGLVMIRMRRCFAVRSTWMMTDTFAPQTRCLPRWLGCLPARRAGPALSAGDYGCRLGMRSRARGREIP